MGTALHGRGAVGGKRLEIGKTAGTCIGKVEQAKPVAAAGPTGRKVPGAAASSVRVDSLWKSQLRWLLKSPAGALRCFTFSSLSRQARKEDGPCTPRPKKIHIGYNPRARPTAAQQAGLKRLEQLFGEWKEFCTIAAADWADRLASMKTWRALWQH